MGGKIAEADNPLPRWVTWVNVAILVVNFLISSLNFYVVHFSQPAVTIESVAMGELIPGKEERVRVIVLVQNRGWRDWYIPPLCEMKIVPRDNRDVRVFPASLRNYEGEKLPPTAYKFLEFHLTNAREKNPSFCDYDGVSDMVCEIGSGYKVLPIPFIREHIIKYKDDFVLEK